MPKTRHISDREKRNAMDLLDIHYDINAVHLLTGIHHRTLRRWRKKLRRRNNATLSEKSISLSANGTMSDKTLTTQQPAEKPKPTLDAARKDSNESNYDLQSLRHIRGQLMIFARRLADDLDPDDPDVNLRTLSLTRILDRIYWLDENLYDGEDEAEVAEPDPPNRIEFVYDGAAHEQPPWHNAPNLDD